MLNASNGTDYPERGYSITYYRIPKSPQAQRDERDAQDWEVERGFASRVEVYMARNPGISRADSLEALKRIEAENQEITQGAPNANELPTL